jgi:hypothetical protein
MFLAVKIITKAVSDIKHARVRQTKVASLFDHPGATQAISGLLSGLLELSNVPHQDKDVVRKINEESAGMPSPQHRDAFRSLLELTIQILRQADAEYLVMPNRYAVVSPAFLTVYFYSLRFR